MNGPVLIPSPQQQQNAVQQVVLNTYLSIVPHVTAARMQQGDPMLQSEKGMPAAIADEAWDIAVAVLAKIGIQVQAQAQPAR